MSTSNSRTKMGNAMMVVGMILIVLGFSFVSAILSGLLGHSVTLDKMTIMGNSISRWGLMLSVLGDIIKSYHKDLTKNTKLLIGIACTIYLLGWVLSLLVPVDRITTLGSIPSYMILGTIVVISIVFWGSLAAGLFRMHQESKELEESGRR